MTPNWRHSSIKHGTFPVLFFIFVITGCGANSHRLEKKFEKETKEKARKEYNLGEEYLQKNDLGLAVSWFRSATMHDPDNKEYYLKYLETRRILLNKHTTSAIIKRCESNPNFFEKARLSDQIELAKAYYRSKQYTKLFECLNIIEKNHRWDATKRIAQIRGIAYIEIGQYAKGIKDLEKVSELQGSLGEAAQILLVTAYAKNNQINEAKTLLATIESTLRNKIDRNYRQAKSVEQTLSKQKITAKGHLKKILNHQLFDPKKARKLGHYVSMDVHKLAGMYMAIGDYEGAYDILHNQYKEIISLKPNASVYESDYPLLYMLNKSLLKTGRLGEARVGYQQLLNLPEIEFNGDVYRNVLKDLADIYYDRGDYSKAVEYYKKAIKELEFQRATINTEEGKLGFVSDKMETYGRMISALFRTNQFKEAFKYIERSKSRALIDMLAFNNTIVGKNLGKNRSIALLNRLSESEAKILSTEEDYTSTHLHKRFADIISLRQEIKKKDPEFSSLIAVDSIDIETVKGSLSNQEALIEYYYYKNDIYIYVVSRACEKALKVHIGRLIGNVKWFRSTIENMDLRTSYKVSRTLFNQLIRPIENEIYKYDKLLIIPHGILHYLPFNALWSGKNYLIDNFSIRILPSASVLKYLKKSQGFNQLMAIGNPDLLDPDFDLKFAQKEVNAISKIYPSTYKLLRQEATETAFKTASSKFNTFHFALHGVFNPEDPLESGLLMAKDDDNDGFLTARELYEIKIDADLVTLSACETGIGKITKGDDVIGISRGFLYAGARSVVSSLWNVDDESTAFLMTNFYRNLKHENKLESLRKAQLATKKKFKYPIFWAAFQLTGSEI